MSRPPTSKVVIWILGGFTVLLALVLPLFLSSLTSGPTRVRFVDWETLSPITNAQVQYYLQTGKSVTVTKNLTDSRGETLIPIDNRPLLKQMLDRLADAWNSVFQIQKPQPANVRLEISWTHEVKGTRVGGSGYAIFKRPRFRPATLDVQVLDLPPNSFSRPQTVSSALRISPVLAMPTHPRKVKIHIHNARSQRNLRCELVSTTRLSILDSGCVHGFQIPIDSDGSARVPIVEGFPFGLFVSSEEGFFRTPGPITRSTEITLQPWARISGQLLNIQSPEWDEKLSFSLIEPGTRTNGFAVIGLETTVDKAGRFQLECLFPGKYRLTYQSRMIGLRQTNCTLISGTNRIVFDLLPHD